MLDLGDLGFCRLCISRASLEVFLLRSILDMPLPDLVDQVFEHIIGRCQTSVTAEELGSREQDLLREQHGRIDAILDDADDLALWKIGVHQLSMLIYECGAKRSEMVAKAQELPEADNPNVMLIARLSALGFTLVESAIELMPEYMIQLSKKWDTVDASGKASILHELWQSLCCTPVSDEEQARLDQDSRPSWLRDMQNQPLSRVIPAEYIHDIANHANCLGKAIMVIAFLVVVDAPVLGSSPILHSHLVLLRRLRALRDTVSRLCVDHGISIPPQLSKAWELEERVLEDAKRVPTRFHLSPIAGIERDVYYMVDPHMECVGLHGKSVELELYDGLMRHFTRIHPGFAVQVSDFVEADEHFGDLIAKAASSFEIAAILWELFQDDSFEPVAIASYMAMREVLRILADDAEFVSEARKELILAVLDGEEEAINRVLAKGTISAVEDAVEGELSMFAAGLLGKGHSRERAARMVIAFELLEDSTAAVGMIELTTILSDMAADAPEIGLAAAGERVERRLQEREEREPKSESEAFAQMGRAVVERLLTTAYFGIVNSAIFKEIGPGLSHPVFEIYEPMLMIGAQAFLHAAAEMTEDQIPNDVLIEVCKISGNQLSTILAATEPLRTGESEMSPLACQAVDLLDSYPELVQSAHWALRELERAGFIEELAE